MPTTPYAKLLASINTAAPGYGGITCAVGDTVDLSMESTVGVTSQRFEIFDYPVGFACPAGWSTDASSGAYFYATTTIPPQFTVTIWGKYMLRLTVNNGMNSAGQNDSTLTDPSPTVDGFASGPNTGTALSAPSPHGLLDLGFEEEGQFSSAKLWAADHKVNLRTLEGLVAGVAVSLSNVAPLDVGTVADVGVAVLASRDDHVHALSFSTVSTILGTANADIDLNGQTFTNLATPVGLTDAATKVYVDTIGTPDATADTLARRGPVDAEAAFGWIAPALTSVATDGFIRTTKTAQAIVASASALTPGADLKSLYLAGGDVIGIGDGLCQGVNVQGTGFYFVDTSANSLLALDTNAAFANIGTFSVTAATAINLIGADVDVDTHKITSLATCTAGTDAANKDYVDGYKADVQVFTGAGASNWTKPTNGKRTLVILKGGDGGGGSGQRGSVASTSISGGAGGGGAGISWAWLDTASLGATVAVTRGAKGAGGAAQTVDDTNGVAGGAGGTTTFGTYLQATGGGGGGGGATAGATGGAGGYGTFNGAPGASATAGAAGTVGPVTGLVPGGASGGGVAGGPIVHDGGAGSPATSIPGTQAAGGVSPGGNGGNGTNGGGAASGTPGMSGGGGASSSAAAGGAGGLAGTGGAGGSGGGAAVNTFNSGPGSDGADGWAIVITLCA